MSATDCQCGRPAQGANLCPTCGETLRANLNKIADRWADLEQALTTPGTAQEKGKTKHGMIAVGTNLNPAAVAARREATNAVWFFLQVVRDDLDTMRRPFTPPRTSPNRSQDDSPALARWLATWQVAHATHTTSQESAWEIARDVEKAEQLTYRVCETTPPRRIDTGMPCEGHGTTTLAERVPCGGVMRAALTDAMPDLVCSVDPTHRIPPDVWSRNYWKRHHAETA